MAGPCVVDVWPGQVVYQVPTFATDLYPLPAQNLTGVVQLVPETPAHDANHRFKRLISLPGQNHLGYLTTGELHLHHLILLK